MKAVIISVQAVCLEPKPPPIRGLITRTFVAGIPSARAM